MFDQNLSFSDDITQLSRSCFMHTHDLRRIRPMLDLKTASTIATSIVHAKLDYCNSLFLNIDVTQINRLLAIQNALVRAVTKTPKHHHITPVLKKLHWLKIPERIEYKVISLTYNTLQSSQPSYLRQLFTIQPPRSTCSSSTLTLLRPSVTSSLKFSNRSIIIIIIVISKLLKHYSKAKRTRAPAYSRALRRIKGGFPKGGQEKLRSEFQSTRRGQSSC